MSDQRNDLDDTTQDPGLRAFLEWRATNGPRPRGSAATASAIAERLDPQGRRAPSWRLLAYALGGAALSLLVLGAAAFVLLRLPAQGPATQPSPTPGATQSASCPPRGAFVPGAASADQLSELWAERIEGDIGSGAIVFPTPVHQNSAGQRELWFADGTLESPQRIASLGTSDGEPEDGYDIRVAQISADRSAALVEIFIPVPKDDPLALCDEWFVVRTSDAQLSRVAGPGEDIATAALSPDGTKVAFVLHDAADGIGNGHVDVRDVGGASLGRTALIPEIHTVVGWSPDSTQLAVASGTWASTRPAAATSWGDTLEITGLNGEPESVVWPATAARPVAAYARRNEAGDEFDGFSILTIDASGHQFLAVAGEGQGPWAPRTELSPDGTHLRASRFVSGDYIDVILDVAAATPSLTNLNSDFGAQWLIGNWQWSLDSSAIEQSAATDTGGQIVSVPIDGVSPETTLVTFTTLWGDDDEWVIGRTAWIGP